MPEVNTQTIPTTPLNNANINKIGQKALQSAPEPLRRLIAAINPSFYIETGKVQAIGPQPSGGRDPIAVVAPGNPNQIGVTEPSEFIKDPQQTAMHEFSHLVQNNLSPEQKAQIPPATGDPTISIDPAYLAKQRKAGKTILQLPLEQQGYLVQFYQSKQEMAKKGYLSKKEMAQIEKIYGPWIKDFDKVQLSNIKQTDPNSFGTIDTTPRAPLPPVYQSTVQFPTTPSTIPVPPGTPDPTGADIKIEKPLYSPRPSQQHKPTSPKITAHSKHDVPFPADAVDDPLKKSNLPSSLRQQIIKGRIADVENPANKNPFRFTHPLDQQAATFAKAKRIVSNPRFSALGNEQKTRILSNYYDKYVVPVYHNAKLEAPDKAAWTSQVQKDFFKTEDFYQYSTQINTSEAAALSSAVSHAQASALEVFGHVGHAILMGGVAVDRKILGMANFLPGSALHTYVKDQQDFDARLAAPAERFSQDVIDRPQFWLDTHPSKTFTEKAGSFVGEATAQMALYEGIGGGLSGIGKVVTSTGGVGRAANLTRRLASNKAGQFVAKRLGEAASSYLGDVFSETKPEERTTDMLLFMGLGAGGDTLKGLKGLTKTRMKKQIAENVAIGGKVFHEQVADQAEFELVHDIIGTDSAGNPIHYEAGKGAEQMQAAGQADPVKHSVVTAEKVSQNAMARQLYGKPLRDLSQLQRRKVRVELVHLTNEATKEIPIHVPEVVHHEVQQSIQEDYKNNPALKPFDDYLEKKYGKKIEDVLVEEEQSSVAASSGIKSSQGATRRIGENEKILADADKSMGSSGTPFKLRTEEEIGELTPAPKTKEGTAKVDLPKSYVSFRSRAVANFVNPFSSKAAEAKQSLAKFVDGMDDADFVQEISDQMGNQIKFEKPFDMLLWGLHHGESIPSPITNKIKKVLHDQDPNGTIKDWKAEARRLGAHIDMLAMSGRLDTEGNVFRSTITTSFTGRTRWQREAQQEAAKEELENYKNTMAPYKKNFADVYNEGLKQLAKLQLLRRAAKTDEDFFNSHDQIKSILEDAENR